MRTYFERKEYPVHFIEGHFKSFIAIQPRPGPNSVRMISILSYIFSDVVIEYRSNKKGDAMKQTIIKFFVRILFYSRAYLVPSFDRDIFSLRTHKGCQPTMCAIARNVWFVV